MQDPSTYGPVTVVDGNNVIGAVPDGWWRDRPAAVRRLLTRLTAYWDRDRQTRIILVLDVPQADLPAGIHEGVEVRYPSSQGRDAADREIIALLDELGRSGASSATVVTSDRTLAADAEARNATVIGARTFLRRLASGT